MNRQILRIALAGTAVTSALLAQSFPRQAAMVGGGSPDRGKCTIEVVVDDVAQVEIRGTSANLMTMSGRPAQWRRFECNGQMPANPVGFRFAGVDGRGRQTLIREPRNGGPAIVQIEDKDGGAEGYTFDIFWDSRGGGGGGYGPPPSEGQYRPGYRDSDYYRRNGRGFGVDEAIRVCQDAVSNQASRRFRGAEYRFGRTAIDDGPGRQDWVLGSLEVRRRDGREDRFRFSCSVDFGSGRVRSANLDERPSGDGWRR